MLNLLRGVLLCSPFIHYLTIGTKIRTSQALLSILLEFTVILFFLNLREIRRCDFRKLSVFWGYIIINSMWYIFGAFNKSGKLSMVSIPLIHISVFFLFYYMLATRLTLEKYFSVIKWVVYPALAVSLLCIFQYFGIHQFYFSETWINGVLGNPTDNAMYLTACVPFVFLYRKPYLPLALIMGGLVVLNSASAMIAALIVLITMLFIERAYKPLSLVLLALVGGIVKYHHLLPTYLYENGKLGAWGVALEAWSKRCMTGYGLDTFRLIGFIDTRSGNAWAYVHNHYIWVLHSLGIIGFIFFILWLSSFKVNRRLLIPFMSVLSVGIMSFMSVPFRIYPIVLLTAFNLSVLTKEVE